MLIVGQITKSPFLKIKMGYISGGIGMRKRDFKGKVVKKRVPKAATVCRCYDDLQLAALDVFEADNDTGILQSRV